LKEHLHEYDDNWKCKCGQKLVVDISEGRITIKGFMTPNGKFVPLSEAQGPAQSKRAKGATEGNQSDGDDSPEEE
jgi:hypothetical protein